MTNNIKHIAIICDGNGRWASERGLSRSDGHKAGEKALIDICKDVSALNIPYLTIYGFSTENWSRSKQEVFALVELFAQYLKHYSALAETCNYRFRIIGSRQNLKKELLVAMDELEQKTALNTGLNIQIAFNYGGRDEIIRACEKLLMQTPTEENVNSIADFEGCLDTKDIPDPDIIIRTGGEQRLSNFLLWQCAYSELFFVKKYWPDFSRKDLEEILVEYSQRTRKYGGVNE